MEKEFKKGQIVRSEGLETGKVVAVIKCCESVHVKFTCVKSVDRYSKGEAKKYLSAVERKESGKITSQKLEADGFELNHRNSLSKKIGKIIVEMPEDGKFFLYSEESTNTHVLYINTFEQLEEAVNFLNKNEL